MMELTPLQLVIKPSDCLFAVTFPMDMQSFLNDLKPGVTKQFSMLKYKEYGSLIETEELVWLNRVEEAAKDIKKTGELLQSLGGTVHYGFKIKDFESIGGYKCIILQAHCDATKKEVELFDGMYSIMSIVNAMPAQYCGLFDLVVCQSDYLAYYIKKKYKHNCNILQNKKETTVEFRMPVLRTIFKMLSQEDMNYADADILIRKTLNEKNE